jgi:hypothetical protein
MNCRSPAGDERVPEPRGRNATPLLRSTFRACGRAGGHKTLPYNVTGFVHYNNAEPVLG